MESLKNAVMMVVFFGIILFILLVLGWKTVALVLAYIFALITIVSLITFLLVLFGAIGTLIAEWRAVLNDTSGKAKGLILTLLARFAEEVICVFLTIALYAIFYIPGILIKG